MDGWPRIPHPNNGSGKTSPRTTSTSLPAAGTTVVANVEEDLGEGMYALRWAGQRIHVSSRAPLAKGQGLLLKSETSPEMVAASLPVSFDIVCSEPFSSI